jgi:hypothetical protein
VRLAIRALLAAGGLALVWLNFAVGTAAAQSAADAYGGQGRDIEPSSPLPFTGLNLVLLIAAAAALIALGTLLRWRLMRHRPSSAEGE